MALGASINYSLAAVGTTVSAVNQQNIGKYAKSDFGTDVAGVNYPLDVTFQCAKQQNANKQFGLIAKANPAVNNALNAVDQGRITVSINVSYRLGAEVTDALVKQTTKYAMSLLLPDAVFDSLVTGALV